MKKCCIVFIIISLYLYGCELKNDRKQNLSANSYTVSLVDTIDILKDKALIKDSLEYTSATLPYTYLKTGSFLDNLNKVAVQVQYVADTTFVVKLFVEQDKRWVLHDSVPNLFGFQGFLDIRYSDYDFDGINDIYIIKTVSNGLPVYRGHLLIVDSSTWKLKYQKEAEELGNIIPYSEDRIISSQEVVFSDDGDRKYKTSLYKWVGERLVKIETDIINVITP